MARRQQDGINEAAADAVRGAVGHMLRVLMENLETKSRTYKNKVCMPVHCSSYPVHCAYKISALCTLCLDQHSLGERGLSRHT